MKETKVRIDKQYIRDNVNINDVLSQLSPTYERTGILVFEKEPKEHYHAYIEAEASLPTLRKRLDEVLTSKGNQAKSVSQSHHDWDVYKGYLFKYESTEVIHLGTQYEKEQLIKAYNQHKNTEDSGEAPNSIVVQLECYLKDKHWDSVKELGTHIINYHIKKKKLLDKHYIGKLITTMYVMSGKGQDRFLDEVILQNTPFAAEYLNEENRTEPCSFCRREDVRQFKTEP